MKKIVALGLAATVAIGALSVAGEANARPWSGGGGGPPPWFWGHPRPHPGFYFGFNLGPSYPTYPYAYPPPDWRLANAHVRWCLQNYRTYNPYTDTYHPQIGVTAQCISPWWTYR